MVFPVSHAASQVDVVLPSGSAVLAEFFPSTDVAFWRSRCHAAFHDVHIQLCLYMCKAIACKLLLDSNP